MEAVKGERGIVQIKGCFYSLTPGGIIMQNIVMPLMTKSLGVFIRENRALRKQNSSHRISPELVKNLSFQIVNGLAALHSSGYTHRDFKPDNILLMDTDDSERKFPTINICDLGKL
ncbi:protein kinase, partial [Cryptosporidium parvum Iowa II]